MPFTPFHFGPHASIALPLHRYLDVPIFIGANVIVDIEPLLVLTYDLDCALHGYCHTLVIGGLVGLLWATAAYASRRFIGKAMRILRLPYLPTFTKMAISGVLGVWLHILFDATLYSDIKPFYPLDANPLYGRLSMGAVYGICMACFIPALMIYLYQAFIRNKEHLRES